MAVPVRSQSYHDPMADSRHRRVWFKRILITLIVLIIVGAVVWLFYWSSVFAITDIQVDGAFSVGNDQVVASVRELLAQKRLYVFQPQRNIILLNTDVVVAHLLEKYPAIGKVQITKDYPHAITINVSERHAFGQWCRGDECRLFDREGARWGSTLPSTGPLLLLVQDDRSTDELNSKMLQGLLAAVDGLPKLGMAARKVVLPNAEPGGIRITSSKGYDLYFDILGDVADQLLVLTVFLADRAKDPAFSPQYIDLRTPGRVYYK